MEFKTYIFKTLENNNKKIKLFFKTKGKKYFEKLMHFLSDLIQRLMNLSRKYSLKIYRGMREKSKNLNKNGVFENWMKWLVKHFFDKELWTATKNKIAGGIALGILLALLQIPAIQMILAIIFACFLRVNIPASVMMCWITNPITFLPIFIMQINLGKKLAPLFNIPINKYDGKLPENLNDLFSFGISSVIGVIFSAIFFSFIGYMIAYLLWDHIKHLSSYLINFKASQKLSNALITKSKKLRKKTKNINKKSIKKKYKQI